MSGQARREARRAQARAEFAAYAAPPGPGWWPCPRDPGQFRLYDGDGWTDRTRRPATQSEGSGRRAAPPVEPSALSGRGSAIKRGQAEMARLLHPVTAEDLRGVPEATAYDIEPDRPGRDWW